MIRGPLRSTLFPYTTLFRSSPRCPAVDETSTTLPPSGSSGMPARHTYSTRSEEHTSELQSHVNIVCRLLLEKKQVGVKTCGLRLQRPINYVESWQVAVDNLD